MMPFAPDVQFNIFTFNRTKDSLIQVVKQVCILIINSLH